MRIRPVVISLAACMTLLSLQSCFTRVESTPRISLNDVKKQQAATVTDEQRFLAVSLRLLPRSGARASSPRG